MSEQKKQKCALAPVAAVRPGDKVAYEVQANGKTVLSRGEVFSFRRVGKNRAEITMVHAKTGAMFTNVLKGNSPVMFTELTFDPEGDALTALLVQHLQGILKERMSDFYSIMPVED